MASKPFITHSLQHDGAWNFAWYYTSLVVYAVVDDFRGLELPRTRTRTRTWASRTRTRTRTWKLVLEDKDLPRGQQHCWTQTDPVDVSLWRMVYIMHLCHRSSSNSLPVKYKSIHYIAYLQILNIHCARIKLCGHVPTWPCYATGSMYIL